MAIKLPKRPEKIYKNRPRLLLHGSIPRPMHGVNPRSIMGKEWWDVERKKAYLHNNNYCHACGVYKRDAKLFQWLEAHEIYDIDYDKCRMKFKGVVALCHCCHAVVHSGRTTQLYINEKLSHEKFTTIVKHGQRIFKKYKLTPPIGFRFMELIYLGYYVDEATSQIAMEYPDTAPLDLTQWSKWRLIFQRKHYPPLHKTPEK